MIGDKELDSLTAHQVSRRVRVPTAFAREVYGILRTGAVVVTTGERLSPSRRSDRDFTIVASGPEEAGGPVSSD